MAQNSIATQGEITMTIVQRIIGTVIEFLTLDGVGDFDMFYGF